jgi:hypothetical protein
VRALSSWSSRRLIVACVLWLLGAPAVGAIGLLLGGLVLALFSGHQSIGLQVKLSNWVGVWLFLPPAILIGAWIWSRRTPSI